MSLAERISKLVGPRPPVQDGWNPIKTAEILLASVTKMAGTIGKA